MTLTPTLTTPRLTLRPHEAADLDECVTLWQDPLVTRYTSGKPLLRQDVWTRLLRHPGHWALLGFGYWVVTETASGRFVGEVGLADFRRDLMTERPELMGIPEAGWVLQPWAHGRGYAREAVEAALTWRDRELHGSSTFCLIHPDNAASVQLARRMGFEMQDTLNTESGPLLLLRREAAEEGA